MKVKFCLDNGANIHSCRDEIIDIEKMYNLTDQEWKDLSEDDKYGLVQDWADQYIEIYFESVE